MAALSDRRIVLAIVVAAVSCGLPLVDDGFVGEARLILQTNMEGHSSAISIDDTSAQVALFWSPSGPGETDPTRLVEQWSDSHVEHVPMPFRFSVFDEPGADALTHSPLGPSWGLGRLMAYRDVNGNGRRDTDEVFVGASTGPLVLFAPEAISAAQSPTGQAIPKGYHVASVPLACDAPLDVRLGSEECGVTLGIACKVDADCGTGTCAQDLDGPVPDGTCVLDARKGCAQKGGVLVSTRERDVWVRACETTADCARPNPFHCDYRLRACLATAIGDIVLTDDVRVPSACSAAPSDRDGGQPGPPDGGHPPPPDGGMIGPSDGGCPPPPPLPDGGAAPLPPPTPDGSPAPCGPPDGGRPGGHP